jgi:hypothetical protein
LLREEGNLLEPPEGFTRNGMVELKNDIAHALRRQKFVADAVNA